MTPEISFPCTLKLAICPCLEHDESNPHTTSSWSILILLPYPRQRIKSNLSRMFKIPRQKYRICTPCQLVITKVSKYHSYSILKFKNIIKGPGIDVYCLTLNVKVLYFETSITIYQPTWPNLPEQLYIQQHFYRTLNLTYSTHYIQ
jgi:hypothetical protein